MADPVMIARLAESREFAVLKEHFDQVAENEVQSLARKTFANPEGHDRLEWEKLRAFHKGVEAVFAQPVRARADIIRRKDNK